MQSFDIASIVLPMISFKSKTLLIKTIITHPLLSAH